MSVYLDKREEEQEKVDQSQGCPNCRRGRHYFCTRKINPSRCCCGAQPSITLTFKGKGVSGGTVKGPKITNPTIKGQNIGDRRMSNITQLRRKQEIKEAIRTAIEKDKQTSDKTLSERINSAVDEWTKTNESLRKRRNRL